ncbi:MAG: Ig-like domain-containing protein, partial [Cyanobacteria bacterium J06636_16]
DNGTPTDPTDDTIDYTPNPDFSGADTFTYTITDSNGDTSTAEVAVTVNPGADGAPTAVDDTATVLEDTPVNIPVLANDDFGSDGPGSISITTPPTNGTAAVNDNGTPTDLTDDFITFTPDPNFSGTDTITYIITDSSGDTSSATVTVTVVEPGNTPPVATNDTYVTLENTPFTPTLGVNDLLINDSDPNNDPLTVVTTPIGSPNNGTVSLNSDGTFTYTPTAGFTGTDSFVYEISDGNGGTAQATAIVSVSGQSGTGGPDFIVGSDGDDIINGLSDFDRLDGGGGNDIIHGGSDPDVVIGGTGNDRLNGGTGDDEMSGGEGNDLANGGPGNDVITGDAGDDSLGGGDGDDFLRGGQGNDRVRGGEGNDRLQGGQGNDSLNGGRGDDILVGAAGIDELTGGQGNDIFLYGAVGEFGDTITDFSVVSDRLDLSQVPGASSGSIQLQQSGDATVVQLLIAGQLQTVATLENVDSTLLQNDNFIL